MTEADSAPRTATLPSRGEDVDRYRVLGEIATGGMAAVFAAQRRSLAGFERLVALKVILPHLASDRYFVDMFLDEARIASRVHHANVVQVFDVVEHDGLPCIVMELLGGRSFASLLQRGEHVPLPLRLHVLARVAEGLHAAHATRGPDGESLAIIHRDVSPDNVHVGYDGHVKVVDFGIAAARGRLSSTRTGELKGKLAYLSPEQITSSPEIDEKVDVWGLAVMAWEAVADERLFVGEGDAGTMWNVVHRPVPDLAERAPHVSPEVTRGIMAGLERDPEQRISMPELGKVLSKAAVEGGATATDLATLMQELFAEDKREAEDRLERTLSRAGAIPDAEATPGRVEVAPTVPPAPSPRRRWPTVAYAIGGVALAAVLAERYLPSRQPETPQPRVEARSEQADQAPPAAAERDAEPVAESNAEPSADAASESVEHPDAEAAEPVEPAVEEPIASSGADDNSVASDSPSPSEPARPRKKPKKKRRSKPKAAERGKLLDSPYGN